MHVVQHDDEGIEVEFLLLAITLKGVDKQLGSARYIKQAASGCRDRCHEDKCGLPVGRGFILGSIQRARAKARIRYALYSVG